MPFITTQLENFIGRGITLPLKVQNGRVPIESGFPLVRASIINILSWKFGKRFFLNEYGSQLHQLLEEPNDVVLEEIINVFVVDAIKKWEPRVEKINSTLERTDTKINLQITYRMLNTKTEDTFIFPFYSKIIY